MAFLIVVLLSIMLGFLLAQRRLKLAVAGAIVIPFFTVFMLNLLSAWFGPVPTSAPMEMVVYFTVSIPAAVIALLSLWLFRKLQRPSGCRQQ